MRLIWILIMLLLPVSLVIYNWIKYSNESYISHSRIYYLLLGVIFIRGLYDLVAYLRGKEKQ